jgi:NADPH-dependent 2,4-dienoyl-CoA reductase/sulfur reductase-like enzyme
MSCQARLVLMTEFDVIVVGAGPAGVQAALAAASAGLETALFEENPDVDAALRRQPGASKIHCFFSHVVWSVAGAYRIDALGPQGPMHCTSRALIVASGATERIVPFEGWTTPGVIGLGTAAKLLSSGESLHGRSFLVAGCGPWLAAVAAKIIEGGGHVDAVIDLAGHTDSARALLGLAARPAELVQRLKWWRTIRRGGTARYDRHTMVSAEKRGERLRATWAQCDSAGRAVDTPGVSKLVDCIIVGHGFIPASDITRLLRARHRYSAEAGGWVAVADEDGRTSRALLYVAGDAAGIAGRDTAANHGGLVGLVCAFDLAASQSAQLAPRIDSARRRYRRRARVGRVMANMMALRPAMVDGIALQTIVCRCESVKRVEIDAACDAGARDVNQLKAWTRCGMGHCQGRICGDVAGELLVRRMPGASRESVGVFTARSPLRPVTIGALTGDFEYRDIAIPTAAPL